MFKKTLLSIAVAMSVGTTSASIIDNDVFQGTGGNIQTNGVLSISALSLAPIVVTGTNAINTAATVHVGSGLIASNDTTQVTGLNAQLNGVATLNAINIGDTTVTGVNTINSSLKTLGSVGPVSIIVDNDTEQTALFNAQINGVAEGSLVRGDFGPSLATITVDGTNSINAAQTNAVALGLASAVIGNDIDQLSVGSLQVNGVAQASLLGFAEVNVTGVNSVNSAQTNIGSLGIVLNGVAFNDIDQVAVLASQTNGVAQAELLSVGSVTVTGSNFVNSASMNIAGAGILDAVVDNNIDQRSALVSQENQIVSLAGLTIGDMEVTGINSINAAEMNILALSGVGAVIGNDIDQRSVGAFQQNEIDTTAALSLGNLTLDGVNSVNQASTTIVSPALIGSVVAANDINQFSAAMIQSNNISVNTTVGPAATVGAITLNGVNSINAASMDITQVAFGGNLAIDNNINQATGGNVQLNTVDITAGANVGPINVTGSNSINAASMNIVQTVVTP